MWWNKFLLLSTLALAAPGFCIAEVAIVLDPALEKEAQWVFGQVLSPFCPGKLLHDCPSSAASKLKTEIREKINAGKSREDVIEELYVIYGDEISAVPRTTGFGLVAWITPALFILMGLLTCWFWLNTRLRKRQQISATTPTSLSAGMQKQIDALLDE